MKLNKTVAFTTPIDVDSKYYFVFGMYDFGMHDIVYARKSGLGWYFVNNTKKLCLENDNDLDRLQEGSVEERLRK
mgnify:CR=1 FL=1